MPDVKTLLPVATLLAAALAHPVAAQTKASGNSAIATAPSPGTSSASTPAPASAEGTSKGSPAVSTAADKPAPAPAPTPAPPPVQVTVQAPSAEPPRSDLVSGWIGLALLGTAGFFGWKALQRRGVTAASLIARLGIEETVPAPPARTTPSAPSAPPLPSLSDLPSPSQPTAPASAPIPSRLVAVSGPVVGSSYPLVSEMTLGRDPGCTVVVGDDSVSRQHARFTWSAAAGWVVADLGSSNGTLLNGRKVSDPVALRPGDQVQFGETKFRFEATA